MNPSGRNSFLAGNLEVLCRQNAAAYRWLASRGGNLEGLENRIITNRRGVLDWRLPSGKGLFDVVSPDSVYRDWIPEDAPEMGATLIVGANLGYGINRVLADTETSHRVLVLEPSPDMLAACLSQTDYRPFLESGKLLFIPPDVQYLKKIIWRLEIEYFFGKIFVLADLPSYQLGPEYAMWAERCKDVLDCFGADLNTMRMKQDTMVQNELGNYARAMKDGNLLSLRGQGRGVSAVIYGAGPSLARFGPLLARHPGTALHACALQSLPALYGFGVKPHFCMAIDYTKAMKPVCEGLDREWAKDIPLVYSCKVDPEAVEAYPGPTLPIWTVGGIGTFLPRQQEVVLNGGGSVGVALTRFLTWCGISRMLLVGFDFSWQGKSTHVAGHLASKRDFCFDSNRHIVMKNKGGETIYSATAYMTALRDLESDLDGTSPTVCNLYGGGVHIQGTSEVTWEEVKEQRIITCTAQNLDRFLGVLRAARTPRVWPLFQARGVEWADSFRHVTKRLKRLSRQAARRQEEIRALFRQIVLFLQQDPLYQPYLFNEIIDTTRLTRTNLPFGQKEMDECKRILKRALKKVREVDNKLVFARKKAA